MKLSEKIQILRKNKNYSQEDLATKCGVSRQAISKWEASTTLPDTENLITLSNLFNISVDVLIKDDLEIDYKIYNTTCHKTVHSNNNNYYEGLLIKESISDENILDLLNVNKIELWKTENYPKYWTAIYFTSPDIDLPNKFSKVMISDKNFGGNWYVDFKHNNTKYIVFKDKILKYEIGNTLEKEKVESECKKLGILDISDI